MFCPNCGNVVDDDAVTCEHCGNKMVEEVAEPVAETVAEVTAETPVAEKACQYCGTMVPEDTQICPVCNQEAGGKQVETVPTEKPVPVKPNVFALISLILSCVNMIFAIPGAFLCIPPVGSIVSLVLGIIGAKKSKKLEGKGKGLSIAGIILSIISIVFFVIGLIGWLIYIVFVVAVYGFAIFSQF